MIKGKMVAEGSVELLAREKFGVGEKEYTMSKASLREATQWLLPRAENSNIRLL